MSRLGGIGISASMSGLSARNAAIANMAQQLMQGAQFWAAMQEQRDEARRQRKWQEEQQKKAEKKQGMGAMLGGGGAAAGAGIGAILAAPTGGLSVLAGAALGAGIGAGAGVATAGATGNSPFAAQAAGGTMANAFNTGYGMEMQQQQMGMQQERLGMARTEMGFRRRELGMREAEFGNKNMTLDQLSPPSKPTAGPFVEPAWGPRALPQPSLAQQLGMPGKTTLSQAAAISQIRENVAQANRPMGGAREPIQFSPEDIDAGVANLETMLDPIAGDPQGGDQRHLLMQDYLDRVGPKMDPAHRSAIVNRWNRKYGYWPRAKNPPTYNLMLGPGR